MLLTCFTITNRLAYNLPTNIGNNVLYKAISINGSGFVENNVTDSYISIQATKYEPQVLETSQIIASIPSNINTFNASKETDTSNSILTNQYGTQTAESKENIVYFSTNENRKSLLLSQIEAEKDGEKIDQSVLDAIDCKNCQDITSLYTTLTEFHLDPRPRMPGQIRYH